MFDNTHDQMTKWSWNNPSAFRDQVDRSNVHTTSKGKVPCIGEHFSWYGSDDPRANIEPPASPQYKPGNCLPVRPPNRYEIIDEDHDDENWAHPGALRSGRSRPGDDNDNDNCGGKEDTQRGELRTGTGKQMNYREGEGKVTEDGTGKWKGKGKGTGNRKNTIKPTPRRNDIFHAIDLPLQMKCQRKTLTWRVN